MHKFYHNQLLRPTTFKEFFSDKQNHNSILTRNKNAFHLTQTFFFKTVSQQLIKFWGIKVWKELPSKVLKSKLFNQYRHSL